MFLSISSSMASSVDLLGLNPYCWFDKSLCDVYVFNVFNVFMCLCDDNSSIGCAVCIAFSNIFEITGRTDIGL